MKKSIKIWCAVAGILMLVGIIIAIMAVKSGASTLILWIDGKFKVEQETVSLEKSPLEDFENIDVELQISNIEFIASDGYYIEMDECLGSLEYEIVDDTLKIKQTGKVSTSSFGFGFRNNEENMIRVYYPEDTKLNKIDLEMNMGNLIIGKMNASVVEVDCDMGNVEIEESFFEDILIEANMGNVELKKVTANQMNVNADMGNIEGSDIDLLEDGIITCNMGNVEMSFEKPVESYEIYAKIKMGELSVDDEEYGSSYESEGEISLEVTDDMGNIELNFNE